MKKRIISCLLILALCAGIFSGLWFIGQDIKNGQASTDKPNTVIDVWDGTYDTSWYKATQSEFILTTPEQVAGIDVLMNEGVYFRDKTIKLGNDIYLNFGSSSNNWTPIGLNSKGQFYGSFDGQGYTIFGLNINPDEPLNSCGFFKTLSVDSFKNIIFEDVTINNINGNVSSNGTGILSGLLMCGEIENITIKNAVVNGSGVGTLTGSIGGNGAAVSFSNINIKDTYLTGDVIGGLFTWLGGVGLPSISNCDIDLNFDASSRFAGLGYYQNTASKVLDNVNLTLNGETNEFSVLFSDFNSYFLDVNFVIKNSKISGNVEAERNLNLGVASTMAENCELTLKINNQLVTESPLNEV